MTIIEGINAGFVTVTPVSNPSGLNDEVIATGVWFMAFAAKFVAPAGAINVNEIGWFTGDLSGQHTSEVGIYSHDSGNDEPDVLLGTSGDFLTGTSSGWKSASLDVDITEGTTYWLTVRCSTNSLVTRIDATSDGSYLGQRDFDAASLTNPYEGTTKYNKIFAIYGVYTSEPSSDSTIQGIINIVGVQNITL